MKPPHESYEQNVFINCPFDEEYEPLLDALLFVLVYCGYRPRCALEIRLDSHDQTRLDKLFRIIEECRFGIHDLSRTTLDALNSLPRFNMPLELGMFIGIKRGRPHQRRKVWLGLDQKKYTYQKCISDLAGIDIPAHGNDPCVIVRIVRDWLNDFSATNLPSTTAITRSLKLFMHHRPEFCKGLDLDPSDLAFRDRLTLISGYIAEAGQTGNVPAE